MGMRDESLEVWLRAENFDGVFARGENLSTPLMRAAQKGDLAIARKLLAAGGDFNASNADGNNAVWLACFGENVDLLTLLIEAGLDIDHANENGATALMFAASSGRTAMVECLLNHGADIEPETPDGFSAMDMASNAECLHLLRAARKRRKTASA